MKILLTLVLCLATFALEAQDDSYPGRTFLASANPPIATNNITPQSLFTPLATPVTQSSSAIAEQITPDIKTLAGNLDYDPTRIFNYVHDQIRYVHYFGSLKGAELTYLERSGNDFDQCALLMALLQASGVSNGQYQFGYMEMPYFNGTNNQDVQHWLALSMQNTNFAANTLSYFSYLQGTRGFDGPWSDIGTNTLVLPRVWVTLTLGGTNYYLDPAFKVSEPVSGVNLGTAMGLSTSTLWTAAGGTDTGYSVSGLNEGSLRGALQNCNSNLLAYITNNLPNASVAQVVGGQQIVPSSGLPLATSLLFPVFTNATFPLVTWTNQPTNFMSTFAISFSGTNQTWFTPQLMGQRISLTFDTNGIGRLWLEDSNILQTSNAGASNTLNVILTAQHPYGGWNSGLNIPVDTGYYDKSSTNLYLQTNANYAILYSYEPSQQWLQKRQQKLDAYRAQGFSNTSRQVTTETLNVMGLGWMVQTESSLELLSDEWGQLSHHHHRFGRMAQEQNRGYYVDVFLQQDSTFPNTGYNPPDLIANNQTFDVSSYIWSAMEHGIIEQLQDSNIVAASTVKMLEIASTNSQTIYMANSSDWTSGAYVRSSLLYYGNTLSTLDGLISQGFTLLLPQNGSNEVAGAGTWAGNGYVELQVNGGNRFMGMVIGGTYNGGYDSNPSATVNPTFTSLSADSQPDYFDPQSATLPLAGQTGADPVNLVDGSFELTSSDLSIGQAEPRGLHLTTYYSSARQYSNPAGMAPGWLNSYYCNVLPVSDPESGLGTATVQQMTPMIVATYAALNMYTNTGSFDPKNWMVTALISKWGIDQLIGNAVSINLGNSTVQFTRQPNGLYTPPGNCTMTLTQSGGSFILQERNGRTFKFGANNVLTNITDQYGQMMKLAYNSNNLVTNVTDWKGRSFTFNYTTGVLTSVSDSAGRSVSYGYTNGELTSHIDSEQKPTTYIYDTNNELVATLDALGRLVETNYYDGFGHITTQLTEGDTNKTWQIFANGYQTVEVDPAGDQRTFTYDAKSRLIAMQDGMGNVTQSVYDGQDHIVQTISPLFETNEFFYDGNNNLIESINSLNYSNVYTFDSLNRLIASRDADGNTSHFGYNAQSSLTGSTNGNGDYFIMVFNTDGTLQSRTDSGGTTTYGSDSYGQVNSITYPGSIGIENFGNSALGDITNQTDARGFVTAFQYNARRELTNSIAPTNLITSVAFDPNDNVSMTTDARGFVASNSWSVTRHLLTTTLPMTAQGSPTTTSVYDSRDWLASSQNPLGKSTYYTNDAAHRITATTDPLNRTTTFVYDGDNHPITNTDAALEQTIQTFDSLGNVVRVLDAATDVVARVYDGAANLTFLTNRDGKVWQFQYDKANRLTNTVSPLNHSASEVYNNRGLLQSSIDPLLQTTSFGYDARGRMTSKTDNMGVNNYQYDGNNNLTLMTNVGTGIKLSWSFDAYNRATSFTNASGYVIQYRYDANGNVTNLIYPGNLTVQYFYDSNNRLTNVMDWAGRQTAYNYDLAGRLTSIARPNSTLRTMGYDDAGQLTNIVEKQTSQFPIAFYTLHYDLAGRSDWEFKGPLPHAYTAPTRNMTYDFDDHLATFNTTNVMVDADGNLTYGPLTNSTFGTYAYNARNELTNAGGMSYGYDPAGNRFSITNGATNTTFVTDSKGSQILMRIINGTTNYYIFGAAGLAYEIDETSTTTNTVFYHFDIRGSTIALTDKNGNLTDQIEYSPYGTTTYRTGSTDTPFLYNGQYGVQTDPNGLLYMRARYYNPFLSRFINPDPSAFVGGLNFYAYANGDPISLIDPFGVSFLSVTGHFIEGAAIGAGVTIVVIVAAPEVAAGGAAALVWAGVSETTAASVAVGTVDTGLLVAGGAGLAVNGVNTAQSISQGNWNQVAYNVGNLVGGYGVGVSPIFPSASGGSISGGRYIADSLGETAGVGPSPAPQLEPWDLPGALTYEWANRLQPTLPDSDLGAWSASAPTPFSGATAATGLATLPGSTYNLINQAAGQSSSTGK